jgi:hypothetical protein
VFGLATWRPLPWCQRFSDRPRARRNARSSEPARSAGGATREERENLWYRWAGISLPCRLTAVKHVKRAIELPANQRAGITWRSCSSWYFVQKLVRSYGKFSWPEHQVHHVMARGQSVNLFACDEFWSVSPTKTLLYNKFLYIWIL